MWKREVRGLTLTFRLAGINNQNFLMRDDQTGSYWQQISGKAVSGPMKGSQLELVHSDELTFALWKGEHPSGKVLKPVAQFQSEYETKDWDVEMAKARTVVSTSGTPFGPRELMFGVELNGRARAYVLSEILKQKLIQDTVGGTPVIVVVGADNQSVRVFQPEIPGVNSSVDFYREPATDARLPLLMDAATGSRWSFAGCAVSGPSQGKCLKPVPGLKDYWFDWYLYHPDTTVFGRPSINGNAGSAGK